MLNYIVLLILMAKLTFGLSHPQILVCTLTILYIFPKLFEALEIRELILAFTWC